MKAYIVTAENKSAPLELKEVAKPAPGVGEVLVKIKANSLNFRDGIVLKGGYPRNTKTPVIPLSDMAGEVVEIGAGVTRYKVGDRVAANFMRDWIGGAINESVLWSGYGGGLDGFLADYAVVPEQVLVRIPSGLSYNEAATLPCAAVTAWNALTSAGLKAGDTILLLGTGGVSTFGLQFAKAAGARVIITSSSDEKLNAARQLGADETINYKTHPEWHEEVRKLTGGRGVDNVLEVGGSGTLERSLKSVRSGGTVSLIGLLTRVEHEPSMLPVLLSAITLRGIYVGSVEMFEAMNRAIEINQIKPVIDRVFPFSQAPEAYKYFLSQSHVGKVAITHE